MTLRIPIATLAGLALVVSALGAEAVKVSAAKTDSNGFLVHVVESPYQDVPTKIRVLLPGKREKDRRYRVLYVLPVEAGDQANYGDGLLEIKKFGLHDRHGLICQPPCGAQQCVLGKKQRRHTAPN